MVNGSVPEFVRVTAWEELVTPSGSLAKVMLEGDSVADGLIPVPVRLRVCGLPAALSDRVRVPVRVPLVVGENVTLMVQLLPLLT
jgi:hypothetical protein